jgi:hypothetical protein
VKRGFEVWWDTGRFALVRVNTATCKTTYIHTTLVVALEGHRLTASMPATNYNAPIIAPHIPLSLHCDKTWTPRTLNHPTTHPAYTFSTLSTGQIRVLKSCNLVPAVPSLALVVYCCTCMDPALRWWWWWWLVTLQLRRTGRWHGIHTSST